MEITFGKKDLAAVARKVTQASKDRVVAFYGAMGSGKTTLIKAILAELGAADAGNSPTFGIVNEYHDRSGELLAFHFDFYRLHDEEEALDLGVEEYFERNCWVFIEWPDKIQQLLPGSYTKITLETLHSGRRKLSVEHIPG
jgi:tRNA threonylcarbamoyladenosine biosynthesis protein TsaE